MLALSPRAVDAIFSAIEGYLPQHFDGHPLGCHRPRTPDRACFLGILIRLVTGCSWDVAGKISNTSESSLRRRRDEWEEAGVFASLCGESIAAYDRVIGLDLSDVAIDGSLHKAPFGGTRSGQGTGPNPTDRGKCGWKWSIATDRQGVPFAWVEAPANVNDSTLFVPTLRAIAARGLLVDVETLHLDRGYNNQAIRELCAQLHIESVIPKRRVKGQKKAKFDKRSLGLRWPVERTNSWLSNFGHYAELRIMPNGASAVTVVAAQRAWGAMSLSA